jgi:hypothetical protein
VTVGERVPIVAHVHLFGRGVQGVRVSAAGPGVSAVRTTGTTGHAHFALRLTRAGILALTIDRQYGCPEPHPQRIGVLGAAVRVLKPVVTG